MAGFADSAMTTSQVLETMERDGGSIQVLQGADGAVYHRVCVNGVSRYCEDRWQAELYFLQMLKPEGNS